MNSGPPGEQEARLTADIARLEKCGADEIGLKTCEDIYDYYKGFTHIDVVSQPRLHAEAFAVGYAAFLRHLSILADIADFSHKPGGEVATRDLARRTASLADDATALRLYAGHAYLQTQAAFIEDAAVKSLLEANAAIYDRFPDLVTREVRNPLRILRRYANARP